MTTSKPFFAQLLSVQELTLQDVGAVSGGTTTPTPIDFKSITLKTTPVTMRYPSDSDGLTTINFPFKTE